MQYRPLGKTGINVSAICLGSMTWGEQNSESDAHQQLDYAVSRGINFIDVAEMYPVPPRPETQGLTESYLGAWLASRNNRESLILATKVAGPGDWLSYLRGGPRLDRKNIEQALDNSLTRLRTNYIDLYQLHWPERPTNFFGKLGYEPGEELGIRLEETLGVLKDLVDSGKIRAVGLSNETPWGVMHSLSLAEKIGLPRVVSIQNPYNLLNRSFELGLAEISHRERVGLLAYSPLAFGVLSGKYLGGARPEGARLSLYQRFARYTSAQAEAATQAYVDIARQHGLDPAQMALSFVNSRPFVTANIIGATSMTQLTSNIDSIDVSLTSEVLEAIESAHSQYTYPCP